MTTITKHLVLLALCLVFGVSQAQDSLKVADKATKIEMLKASKEQIEAEERGALKLAVEAINERLDEGEITREEAKTMKQKVAEKHAQNIENRWAIVDNKIALMERNEDVDIDKKDGDRFIIELGKIEDSDEFDRSSMYIGREKDYKRKPKKYDRRTVLDLVFAIGFNNAIIDGQTLEDSPYKMAGSGFVEAGLAWKTRVFDSTNVMRVKYGVSFQWNKFNIKNNQYLTQDKDGVVALSDFPHEVRKSKFRTANVVVPVHFEFGPSKKIEKEDYFRYSTYKKFKIGLGGYGGFNLNGVQKVKYTESGNKEKEKYKNYNMNSFVYGLSGYVAFGGTALYVKYDLSPVFNNQPVEQRNISVGLRFDMD